MNGYLLDTDIVVFFLRNKKNIAEHLALIIVVRFSVYLCNKAQFEDKI